MKEISRAQTMLAADLADGTKWPRIYRIVVEGRVDPTWSDRLAEMKIWPQKAVGRSAETTVVQGPIRDRSELAGVLNTLSDLHHSPLSLEVIDGGAGETPPDSEPSV